MESESQVNYEELDMDLLIDKIQQYEFLYNVSSARYKDHQKKAEAWQEIAQDLNSTSAECQRAWKNLRDRFVKEKNKFQSFQAGSEVPEEECWKPAWRYYDKMTFYSKFCKHRKYNGTQADNKSSEIDTTNMDETLFSESNVKFEPVHVEDVNAEEIALQAPPISYNTSPVSHELPPTNNRKRLKIDKKQDDSHSKSSKGKSCKNMPQNSDDIVNLLNMAKEICQSINENQQQQKPNVNMKFAEYMAKCLDDLPPGEARKKRRAIMMLLEQ
ncbi:uncharacterized protein LOC126734254 [Anthonomus grandis grandis]|uniref:uncharacterized protein LOC126734254 n=1 Tax=Anthonomus grandis grandis TaxID=2921223 RepID=UPI002165D6C5|nr:uncharacterized protein LOC126734254 [Anthonomus grandis grandis]